MTTALNPAAEQMRERLDLFVRYRREHLTSKGAFVLHVVATFLIGAALVAVGTSTLPLNLAFVPALVLAVGDILLGVVARRRARARLSRRER